MVQIATGLAAPWPLKVVLDSVVGDHPIHRIQYEDGRT